MKVNDIRPAIFEKDAKKASLQDAAYLVERKDQFVAVPCPACGADDFTYKYSKLGITYVDCDACTTMYVNPRPPEALLGEFYRVSKLYKYWAENIFPSSDVSRREMMFKPRVDKILSVCTLGQTSLLEVGAAYGTFCEELMSRNIFKKIVAVEPVPALAQVCRDKGITTIESPIEKVHMDELFDVVANFEVIEHLFSPYDFLKNCNKFLRPGGLMILTCPNGKGFDIELLGTVSSNVDHEHLNYFNPHSARILFERCGFEIVEITTPGKLDAELVRREVVDGTFELVNPFLRKVLIEEWERLGKPFQEFLSSNNLSSSMCVVAKKVTDSYKS